MAMLPSPLIPDANQWIAARQAGYEQGEAQRRRNLLLEAGALAAASPAISAPTVAPAVAMAGSLGERTRMAESGGRLDARNPNSSAYGPDQFIARTWLDVLKRHRPDIAAGKSDSELLALRSNSELSGAMRDAYTAENQSALRAAGLPVTDGTSYLSHFAGAGGAKSVLSANPSTPVAQILSPSAIRANPFLQGMTAADLRAWADRKVGGAPAPVQTVQARPLDPDAPLRNASNALLRGGELQAGLGLQNQLYERSEKARAQAEARRKEGEALFGELALRADTPEKWARAVEMARQGGLPVAGLEDFSAREFVIARAGKSMDYMSAGKGGIYNKTLGRYEPRDPNAPVDEEGLSKNPTWLKDNQGKYHIGQLNESGDPRIAKFPEGYEVLPPSFTVDTGTGASVRARPGGGEIGTIAKDVAGEAAQKKTGEGIAERNLNQPEARLKVETAVANLDALRDEVKKLKSMPGLSSATGAWQSRLPNVWQSTADADSSINNIKGKAATSALQAMRDASKTGGAVGNVTEKEWPILESMIGNLDRSQGDKLFVERLNELEKYTEDAKARIISAHQRAYGSSGQAGPSSGAIDDARAAIARGAPRDAVIQRLRENGIDPSGL